MPRHYMSSQRMAIKLNWNTKGAIHICKSPEVAQTKNKKNSKLKDQNGYASIDVLRLFMYIPK